MAELGLHARLSASILDGFGLDRASSSGESWPPFRRPGKPGLPRIDTERVVAFPEITTAEQACFDDRLLGFCLNRHVLPLYQRQRRILQVVRSDQLTRQRHGEAVRVAGLVVCRRHLPPRKIPVPDV